MSLSTIAIAYRSSTVATTLCGLEAAGFDVFCPGFHIANTLPHLALGIGGVAIAVPENQSTEALAFLRSVSQHSPNADTFRDKAITGLSWLAGGVSSPWPDLLLKDAPISLA